MSSRAFRSLLIHPVSIGIAWAIAFFYPVLFLGQGIGNRDIVPFHLPLRAALRRLVELGPPVWNPWLNGGQPVLSNPNYAAFYPPTWLCLLVTPEVSLSLLAVGHFLFAFFGAYRLARYLRCDASGALLAALGFSGFGPLLSLLSAYTTFITASWLPWILLLAFRLADECERDAEGAVTKRRRGVVLLGAAIAMQFFCGEPVATLLSALALLAIGLAGRSGWRRRLPAFALAGIFALALASVQLVPTLGRLAETARAEGLSDAQATDWSMPPIRGLEILFPRLFGDPSLCEQGLCFNRGINDRTYPYILSLYPGALLALVGAACLFRGGLGRRAAWVGMIALSIFLALGRHNALFMALRAEVPILSVVRYPEKFIVLGLAALVFAGALGWSRLVEDCREGRKERATLPLALATATLAAALAIAAAFTWSPAVWREMVARLAPTHLEAGDEERAHRFIVRESWTTAGCAGAVAGLLLLLRLGHGTRRELGGLAVAFTALDLWSHGHLLLRPIPLDALRTPPPLVQAIAAPADRIYVQLARPDDRDFIPRAGESELAAAYANLDRLEPYSGAIWGLSYALNGDYDLMLTRSAREALETLQVNAHDRELGLRILGAWNVGTVFLRKPEARWQHDLEIDPQSPPLGFLANRFRLPHLRFVPRVAFHASLAEARQAAQAEGWRVDSREHCVATAARPAEVGYPAPADLRSPAELGGRIQASYRAEGRAALVVASTYDRGWRAWADDRPLPIYPTAAGQMLVEVPAGKHRVRLEYGDPLLAIGGAVSALALAAGALLAFRRPRTGLSSGVA